MKQVRKKEERIQYQAREHMGEGQCVWEVWCFKISQRLKQHNQRLKMLEHVACGIRLNQISQRLRMPNTRQVVLAGQGEGPGRQGR